LQLTSPESTLTCRKCEAAKLKTY